MGTVQKPTTLLTLTRYPTFTFLWVGSKPTGQAGLGVHPRMTPIGDHGCPKPGRYQKSDGTAFAN